MTDAFAPAVRQSCPWFARVAATRRSESPKGLVICGTPDATTPGVPQITRTRGGSGAGERAVLSGRSDAPMCAASVEVPLAVAWGRAADTRSGLEQGGRRCPRAGAPKHVGGSGAVGPTHPLVVVLSVSCSRWCCRSLRRRSRSRRGASWSRRSGTSGRRRPWSCRTPRAGRPSCGSPRRPHGPRPHPSRRRRSPRSPRRPRPRWRPPGRAVSSVRLAEAPMPWLSDSISPSSSSSDSSEDSGS